MIRNLIIIPLLVLFINSCVTKLSPLDNNSNENENTQKVATPIFDIAEGSFTTDQVISISCETADATIYYTTDGSEPTSSSDVYLVPIAVAGNGTVKNIKTFAAKADMQDSDVASATYSIVYEQLSSPTLDPASGSFSVNITVAIAADVGATIYYTTDGNDPTIASLVYSTPISVSGNGTEMTIKAIAVKEGKIDSVVASEDYTINYAKVSTPAISPVAATYNNDQSVTITCLTDGAAIYYTTNGDTPTSSSTLYTVAFTVSTNTTVKAIALKNQMEDSDVAQNAYVFAVATPAISPASGSIASGTTVTITSTTSGASIYYTTDGSTPTVLSTLYNPSSKPTLSSDLTLTAKAFKTNYADSSTASATYTVYTPIYVAGSFTSYNDGSAHSIGYVAKLGSDGTFDTAFKNGTGTGFNSAIYALALQSDGKMLVGGLFNGYSDDESSSVYYDVRQIARINTDGTCDTTFVGSGSYEGFNSLVGTIALQADGKVLAGGTFTSYDKGGSTTTVGKIARLNTDGAIDSSFNSGGTGFNGEVLVIVVQSDGKILVGGNFTSYNDGTAHAVGYIARLTSTGTLDTTFNSTGTGFDGRVLKLVLQADGKILAVGRHSSYNDGTDHAVGFIARLTSTGTLDTTFNSTGIGFDNWAFSIAVQTDGKILVVGMFTAYNDGTDHTVGFIARLTSTGTLDTTFNSGGTGFNNSYIYSIAVQSDGKILVGGKFTSYNDGTDHVVGRIIRLTTSGVMDNTFNNAGTGFSSDVRAIAF